MNPILSSIIIILLFRVAEAYTNQKQIESKIKLLNQNTGIFLKQTQQWIQSLDHFNTALKVHLYIKILISTVVNIFF